MRPTRVLYVENDPALRGIVASMLGSAGGLEVLFDTSSPAAALEFPGIALADVALIDLALGASEMNGVDLGIALRQMNPHIGIVIHSQYPLDFATDRVPADQLLGWSTLQKSGQMDIEALASLLKATARGIGQRTHLDDDPGVRPDPGGQGVLAQLSSRQQAIMALTASGYSPQQIAQQLSMSYQAVRQDLARSYRVLVPGDSAGDDRKTQAVLAFVRLTREAQWESP